MKKQLLFILIALLGIATGAWADEVKVAGTKVDLNKTGYVNCDSKKLKSGTVYFDASKRELTLNSVEIEMTGSDNRALYVNSYKLTVKFVGSNRLYSKDSNAIYGNGCELTLVGDGNGQTNYLESVDKETIYLKNCPTTISGTFDIKATNSYGINTNYSNSSSLYIQYANIKCYGKKRSVKELNFLSVLGDCNLTFSQGTSVNTFEKLGTIKLYGKADITSPDNVYFDADKKTLCSLLHPDGVGGTIQFKPQAPSIKDDSKDFPDAKFREALKQFDTEASNSNLDGYLSTLERYEIKDLTMRNKGISSLTGVSYLYNLRSLSCETNALSSLDLSKNGKLTTLACTNCDLTSLKVSSTNVDLEVIYCYDNKLRGQKMKDFIASLPNVKESYSGWGILCVYDYDSDSEQNAIEYADVLVAQNKGYKVCARKNGSIIECNSAMGSNGIAIDSSHFPDDKFRKVVKNYDIDGSNSLTDDEIAKITDLDLYNKSIYKLDGIEYLTELKTIDCRLNNLTSIDLSGNKKLQKLDCSSQRDALKTLILPASIQTLNCSDNSSLGTLNLSACINLQELRCHDCGLTSLLVAPGAYGLRTIYCYNNKLRGQAMQNFFVSLPNYLAFYSLILGNVYIVKNDSGKEQNELTADWFSSFLSMGWYAWGFINSNWYQLPTYFTLLATSGISNSVTIEPVDTDPYYSIDGKRIDGKPAQKGVYIYQGKKIVVK